MKEVHLLFSYIEYGEAADVEGVFTSLEAAEEARADFEVNSRDGVLFFIETHETQD
jgi:hypothetical protein